MGYRKEKGKWWKEIQDTLDGPLSMG